MFSDLRRFRENASKQTAYAVCVRDSTATLQNNTSGDMSPPVTTLTQTMNDHIECAGLRGDVDGVD
jgi:hypothetical protein